MDSGSNRFPEVKRSRKAWIYILKYISKKDEFIPKPYKPLLPSSLHKMGSVFAFVAHGAKNLSEATTIARQALRHSPDCHTSPSDRYTIVNLEGRDNLMIKQDHSASLMKTNHIDGRDGY
jgi:hypothetical protein